MFARIIGTAFRGGIIAGGRCSNSLKTPLMKTVEKSLVSQCNVSVNNQRYSSTLLSSSLPSGASKISAFVNNNLLMSSPGTGLAGNVPSRTVTKFSRTSGKRKVVQTVLKRFYRLNWGIWIRTKTGRHKRLWTKRGSCKRRLRQHVFTNSTQSWMLDKMVSPYWRAPKYWVEDPYNPYHQREEFFITRKNPKP